MTKRAFTDPPLSSESAPFYAAARNGRFLIRRCISCGRAHWYPRSLCPFCFGETKWEQISRSGTIYSYSVMRRADPPYVIAYVTLDAGPTMMTNLVDCDFDKIQVGARVELVFSPSDGGIPIPCFTLS